MHKKQIIIGCLFLLWGMACGPITPNPNQEVSSQEQVGSLEIIGPSETTTTDNATEPPQESTPEQPQSADSQEQSTSEPAIESGAFDSTDASTSPDLPATTDTTTSETPTLPETRPEPQPREAPPREAPPREATPEAPRPACIGPTGKDLCDDGDDCNGREVCNKTTGKCITPTKPTCPVAPSECNQTGGSSSPKNDTTVAATPITGFRLRDEETWTAQQGIVDQIALHASTMKVTVNDVLQQLNRTATSITSVTGLSCLERGFQWNAGDAAVTYWYPQGLAGSATATANGLISGKRVLIASWYHKPENDTSTSTNKGARVSFVDITSMTSIRYRHALLVEPVMVGSQPSFRPIPVHAGGLVWVNNYLYVPDTSKGFRVFDLTRILRVQTSDNNKVGYDAATKAYHGFGYLYVIPQVNAYTRCPGSCCVRFSFASLSIASKPYTLLSGEYTSGDQRGRLHQWPLDPTTGRLQTTHRTVQATEVLFGGTRKMQGAAVIGQSVWISSSQPKASSPTSPGSLVRGQRNQAVQLYRYPYPPEDMHYIPQTGELWSQNEFPNNRYVFAIKTSKLGASCR